MIRPLTAACMLLAGASGLYLYQEKHRTALLDREIARTIHQTAATRAQTDQLRTDWQVLNDPERLRTLADHFLALQPVAPTQWVQWGQWTDLAGRLPAVAAPPAAGGTDEDEDAVAQATPAPVAVPVAAPSRLAAIAPAAEPAPVEAPPAVAAPAAVAAASVPAAPVASLASARVLAALPAPEAAQHPVARPAAARPATRPAEPTRLARAAAPHEAATREPSGHDGAHEPALREARAGHAAPAPVLSAMAGPASRASEPAPVVSRVLALPASRPAMIASAIGVGRTPAPAAYAAPAGAYGGGSAIGGMRGTLPPPTPVTFTPYTGDR